MEKERKQTKTEQKIEKKKKKRFDLKLRKE